MTGLTFYFNDNLVPNSNKLAELQNHPYVGDIRIEGLMIGIEFVKNKQSKDPYPEIVSKLLQQTLEKRLIILSCGVYSNVIRLAPPLIISQEELDKGLTILLEIINDYH